MSGYLGLDTDKESLTFGGFVADLARRYGDGEALIFGDRRITFRQLEARGAAVRPGPPGRRGHEGLVGGAHARQPPRVRDRRLRGRQHRRRRRAGEHVRPERRARLHPAPLRRIASSSPRRRCSTTASSTSCSTATPSWREGVPGQLRSTDLPVPPAHRLARPGDPRDRRALGRPRRTRRRGVRRAPRRGDGRGAPARPRHHHLHLGHERQPEGRAARATARRPSRAGAGARRWASRPTTSCSASSRTSGRRVSP